MTEETSALEFRDYMRVLWRRKWIIVTTVVLCLGISVAMALSQEPSYAASTRVLLERRLVDALFVPNNDQASASAALTRRGNEIQIMNSPKVRAQVEEKLGRAPEAFGFTPVEGTDVVVITSTGDAPQRVARTANAVAETYLQVRTDLITGELQEAAAQLQVRIDAIDEETRQLDESLRLYPPEPDRFIQGRNVTPTDSRVTLISKLNAERSAYSEQLEKMQIGVSVAAQGGSQILAKATPPLSPTNENPIRSIMAGLAIGIVLGIALAFLREYLDDTVKTKEDLESATGLTVVGIIPAISDWKKRDATPLIAALQPRSPAAEAYRSVRTSVEFLALDQPVGSIQVTSALASEGKTSTLANLALTFARAGQRVIVLCCDLRRPRVHEFFGLSNRVGFTSVLLGDTPLATAIQQADRELPIGLLASGPLPPNPAELLASKRAVDIIEHLDQRCDLLLIDSPPVLPVTDALVISGLVDGVLLVASSGSSTKRGVKRATELLRQVDAPLIGGILNGVGSKHEYAYAYGDNRYYLDAAPPEKKPAPKNGNGKQRTRESARAER